MLERTKLIKQHLFCDFCFRSFHIVVVLKCLSTITNWQILKIFIPLDGFLVLKFPLYAASVDDIFVDDSERKAEKSTKIYKKH